MSIKTPRPILDEITDFLNEGQNGETKPEPVNRVASISKNLAEGKPGTYTVRGKTFEIPDWYKDERTPDLPGSPEDLMKGERTLNNLDKMFYKFEREEWEIQIDMAMRRNSKSVLLIGPSGVGKTTMIEEAANKRGLKVKTFNVPTMDAFLQLVGLPNVKSRQNANGESEDTLEFIRKNDLEEADIIFLDEVNRVEEDAQASLFELVNSHAINGEPLPKLRAVWAAMNPPGAEAGYTVHDLEKAFQRRWQKVIKVEAAPKIHHFAGRDSIGETVARTCLRWWYSEIKDQHSESATGEPIPRDDIINPRVLYYIMWEVQRLQNDMFNPAPGEQPISMEEWNADFNSISQYAELDSKTMGAPMPFVQLKRALLGEEIMALSSLRNDAEDIEERVKEAQDKNPDPEKNKALRMANMIESATRGDLSQRSGGLTVPITDIGQFSRVICAMNPNYSAICVVNRGDVAWYLWAKANMKPEQREAYALKQGNPNDPINTPLKEGELDIYKHDKSGIDAVIVNNKNLAQVKQMQPGRANQPGGPATAGGGGLGKAVQATSTTQSTPGGAGQRTINKGGLHGATPAQATTPTGQRSTTGGGRITP